MNSDRRFPMLPIPLVRPRRPARDARPSDTVDAALIDRVARHDLAAFEALYRAYHPRLERFLARMTARAGVAEEVINDTMLVVWNRGRAYNRQSKVSTWIFAIAYRKTLKALQREGAAADEPGDEEADPEAGPERRAAARETRALLAQALERLSFEQRAVLNLTYFHGMGYGEIAQIVECPVDTVKTRMFHARRRLRAILAGDLGDWL